jgi:hypothetical protein
MNVYSVWRFMLDENEKLSRARLATVQMIQVKHLPDATTFYRTTLSIMTLSIITHVIMTHGIMKLSIMTRHLV